jgi:hypothetical protein
LAYVHLAKNLGRDGLDVATAYRGVIAALSAAPGAVRNAGPTIFSAK